MKRKTPAQMAQDKNRHADGTYRDGTGSEPETMLMAGTRLESLTTEFDLLVPMRDFNEFGCEGVPGPTCVRNLDERLAATWNIPGGYEDRIITLQNDIETNGLKTPLNYHNGFLTADSLHTAVALKRLGWVVIPLKRAVDPHAAEDAPVFANQQASSEEALVAERAALMDAQSALHANRHHVDVRLATARLRKLHPAATTATFEMYQETDGSDVNYEITEVKALSADGIVLSVPAGHGQTVEQDALISSLSYETCARIFRQQADRDTYADPEEYDYDLTLDLNTGEIR